MVWHPNEATLFERVGYITFATDEIVRHATPPTATDTRSRHFCNIAASVQGVVATSLGGHPIAR